MSEHERQVAQGERFEFGANWARFVSVLSEDRIRMAEESLKRMRAVGDLASKRFLDVGSGSGLFSLAARRLGAQVHSSNYDPKSIACTHELKNRFRPNDVNWIVEEGSVLDKAFGTSLGRFDLVYSWGVLHHTQQMQRAFTKVIPRVAPRAGCSSRSTTIRGRPAGTGRSSSACTTRMGR